jgi:hypothetical protein
VNRDRVSRLERLHTDFISFRVLSDYLVAEAKVLSEKMEQIAVCDDDKQTSIQH